MERISKYRTLLLVILLVIGMFTFPPFKLNDTVSATSWYDSAWHYSKKIVIDHTKVLQNETNFSVMIYNVSSDYSNAQADGDDFLFASADNNTKYNHEIEYFHWTSGKLVAWVKIPTLSKTVDTVLWMYYGNANATNQQSVTNTWNSSFAAVWHMQYSPTGDVFDSTLNGFTMTSTGSMTTSDLVNGTYGRAIDFDGTDDFLSKADTGISNLNPSAVTLLAWMYPRSNVYKSWNIGKMCMDQYGNNDACSYGLQFSDKNYSGTYERTDNMNTRPWKGNYYINSWNLAVTTHNGGTAADSEKVYVNGSLGNNAAINPQVINYHSANSFYVGGSHTGAGSGINEWTDFIVDEVWILSKALPGNTIQTLYNNQVNPQTFAVFFTQDVGPTTTSISLSATPSATASINCNRSYWNFTSGLSTTQETSTTWINIDNDGVVQVDVTVEATNTSVWKLKTTPSNNEFRLQYGIVSSWTNIGLTPASFVNNLAHDASQNFGLKVYMPTSTSTTTAQVTIITFKATVD
jgi:hypothetical protein